MARMGRLGLEIRGAGFVNFLLPHHSLPFEARIFEIEEERKLQFGDVQISDHLRDVRLGEPRDHLWIYDDRVIDDQVRNQCTNQLGSIEHWERFLYCRDMAT